MRNVSCGEANACESQKSKRVQHSIDKSRPEGEGGRSRRDVSVLVSTRSKDQISRTFCDLLDN